MRKTSFAISCFLFVLFAVSSSAIELQKMSLRTARVDAVSVYSDLMQRPMAERRVLYGDLSSGMKSDLWVVHLQQFMASHPELTPEQRGVVFEGLGIIAAGVFESKDKDSDLVNAVRQLELRAKAIVPNDLFREAFVNLGGADPRAGVGDGAIPSPLVVQHLRPKVLDDVMCECSTESDWCGSPGSGMTCHGGLAFSCTFQTGCGTLWQYACNGLCF